MYCSCVQQRKALTPFEYVRGEEEKIKSTADPVIAHLLHSLIATRPSVRVHWVACGTCTVSDNFFQVGGSLRPFKGSPRSHTSIGPLAHRSSHVRTTKQILF